MHTCIYLQVYMNNHMHRAPFSDIERKKEVAKSKERRKEIHRFINYIHVHVLKNYTITSTASCVHVYMVLIVY